MGDREDRKERGPNIKTGEWEPIPLVHGEEIWLKEAMQTCPARELVSSLTRMEMLGPAGGIMSLALSVRRVR